LGDAVQYVETQSIKVSKAATGANTAVASVAADRGPRAKRRSGSSGAQVLLPRANRR